MTALEEIDVRLRAYESTISRIEANLVDLETDPTAMLVRSSPFEGETLSRTGAAFLSLQGMWSQAQLVRKTVDDIRAERDRIGLFSSGRAEEIKRRLDDPILEVEAAPVPVLQRSLQVGVERRRATVEELMTEMESSFLVARDLITEIHRVWQDDGGRVASLRKRLNALCQVADGLGPAPQAPALRLFAAIDFELQVTEQRLHSDPLGVAPTVDALRRRIDHEERELQRRLEIRAGALDELRKADEQMERLRHLVADGRAGHETTRRLFKGSTLEVLLPIDEEAIVSTGNAPAAWLGRIRALSDEGAWDDVVKGLGNWNRSVQSWTARAMEVIKSNTAPVAKRAELRGRLDALRAKASDVGLGEDGQVSLAESAALAELYRTPCDLVEAERCVGVFHELLRSLRSDRSGDE